MSNQRYLKNTFFALFVLALLSLVAANTSKEMPSESSSFSHHSNDAKADRGWLIKEFLKAVSPAVDNDVEGDSSGGSTAEDYIVMAPQRRVIDPDHILSSEELDELEIKVKAFEDSPIASKFSVLSSNARTQGDQQEQSEQEQHTGTPAQLAVVMVKKMNLFGLSSSTTSSSETSREEWAAEHFATTLHDTWGVGYDTERGGTGILIFMSLNDRVLYVSRGGAVAPILTDNRVDRMITTTLRPYLRTGKYGKAMGYAIEDILKYLEEGPPEGWEYYRDEILIPYGIPAGVVAVIGFFVAFRLKQEREERREYALVSSHLSQIDRAQAEVLQGRYQATSCPICFEEFKVVETGEGEKRQEDLEADEDEIATPSSIEGEGATAVSGGRVPSSEAKQSSEVVSAAPNTAEESSSKPKMLGSDGLPLKLLRCGHVFDETCWAEWVTAGSGDVTKCPICKKDVGDNSTGRDAPRARGRRDANNNNNDRNNARRPPRQANFNDHHDEQPVNDDQQPQQHQENHDDDTPNDRVVIRDENRELDRAAALAQFHRERNFRLVRLAHRFPRYIQQHQLQRWTQSTFDGSLVRDPTFVRSDPRIIQQQQRSSTYHGGSSMAGGGRNHGFSSFGGGQSSGGRSGRW